MDVYRIPIETALITFPFIAMIFTVPYMIAQYRKYERIPVLKVLITYSFIFYMMTAYFLVILPLPSIESVAQTTGPSVILQPLESLREYIGKSNLSFERKEEILTILRSGPILQLVFNTLLVLPFGMYLRYYFRRSWWQTLLLSFGLSLFFEITQLTGLYGIYPRPYRIFELDDLICNTMGGMLGYFVAPVLHTFLPERQELDRRASRVTAQVSIVRRIVATLVDWAIFLGIYGLIRWFLLEFQLYPIQSVNLEQLLLVGGAMLYEIFCSLISGGYTPGKWLLRLRVMNTDGRKARLWQFLIRYLLLYGAIYGAPVICFFLAGELFSWPTALQYGAGAAIMLLMVFFLMFVFETVLKLFGGMQPYRYDLISRTRCFSVDSEAGTIRWPGRRGGRSSEKGGQIPSNPAGKTGAGSGQGREGRRASGESGAAEQGTKGWRDGS